MSAPRGLSAEEAALWEKVAATVTPLRPIVRKPMMPVPSAAPAARTAPAATKKAAPTPPPPPRADMGQNPQNNLDSHWDRRLKAGTLQPELTLDLHGHTLDSAYERLMSGVAQARAMGVRTILLVAGKSRPVASADRGDRRGAIRAKVLDWLAASEHHSAIAAVRRAHIRHGGEGALYIVLKRAR